MPIIEGATGAPLVGAGAPVAGTTEVQTLTIGGTPSGGTFKLAFEGFTTAAITWTATDATLVSNIDTALEALPSIGTGGVTTAAGSVSSGIGTITFTFAGNRAKQVVPTISVADNSLTGTSPTLVVVETTPGVDATGARAGIGRMYIDQTAGKAYINTGTAISPTWTVVGAQT